jgi:hypothetical protein
MCAFVNTHTNTQTHKQVDHILHTFNPQDTSNLLLALATAHAGLTAQSLIRSLTQRALETVEQFNGQDVSNTLWACVRCDMDLSVGSCDQVGQESRFVAGTDEDMDRRTDIFYGFDKRHSDLAASGCESGEGLPRSTRGANDCVEVRGVEYKEQGSVRDEGDDEARAYLGLGKKHAEFESEFEGRSIEGRARRSVRDEDEAVARGGGHDGATRVGYGHTHRRGNTYTRRITHMPEDEEFDTELARKRLQRKIKADRKLKMQAKAVRTTDAVVKTRELVEKLSTRAAHVASDMGPQNVAITLWAFGRSGARVPKDVLAALFLRVERVAADFNTQDVANVMWAAVVLDYWSGTVFVWEMWQVVRRRCKEIKVRMCLLASATVCM